MDYLGNEPYPNPDTPGLIVDDVSYFGQQHTYLPIGSLNSLGHARNYGDASSLTVSLDCHFRCEPVPLCSVDTLTSCPPVVLSFWDPPWFVGVQYM